jgi:hypothetical protein
MSKTLTPKPQIQEQLENLDGSLTVLHNTVNSLLEHLHAAGLFSEEVDLAHYEAELESTSALAGKIEACAHFAANLAHTLALAQAALAV